MQLCGNPHSVMSPFVQNTITHLYCTVAVSHVNSLLDQSACVMTILYLIHFHSCDNQLISAVWLFSLLQITTTYLWVTLMQKLELITYIKLLLHLDTYRKYL